MEKNGRLDAEMYHFNIDLDEIESECVYISEHAGKNLRDKLFNELTRTGDKETDEIAEWNIMYDVENVIQEQYFTQDKINELKLRFIKYIVETPNPFRIYCNDTDTYLVPTDKIFDISVNVNPVNNEEA